MPNSGAIAFRPLGHGDLSLLAGWMNGSHWQQWWGDPEKELGEIKAMVEGADSTRPYIFQIDGEPVGYIQYWHVGEAQCEPWITEYPWLEKLPADAIGIDLSIGSAANLSKGIGSHALRKFASGLHKEGYSDIIIDPDPDNKRAVRAYEKAGFVPIAELRGSTPGVLLMRFDPTIDPPNDPIGNRI